jgi:hypothetical protein
MRGESDGISLHLFPNENAVSRATVSILLEHGSPTISMGIDGEPKRLIIDTG